MTALNRKQRIEFGDFQTPYELAMRVCARLKSDGLDPDAIVEPTCGLGAFLLAAADQFPNAAQLLGYDINSDYLERLRLGIQSCAAAERVRVEQSDFFSADWAPRIRELRGHLLIIGNPPWVTNAGQGAIGGTNLPAKSNFQGFSGLDAITGKANFDISEWMLLEMLGWCRGRAADVAMLVKTSVARKVLAHAERHQMDVTEAYTAGIDAKKHFGAAVDACLLVVRLNPRGPRANDYTVYESLQSVRGRRVGHRKGMPVADLDEFERCAHLLGVSPQKWRSGVKHDLAGVMELRRRGRAFTNGFDEVVDLEDAYVFPLLKGSDVGGGKQWREKFVLVTQTVVGEDTRRIRDRAPNTWEYLLRYGDQLDARSSSIYKNNPRFSVFGVGPYAFRPWRIAICGLYKALNFQLVGPIDGRPVMFDDTTYYVSFDTKEEAEETLGLLRSHDATSLLSSLIFWDEKRPIKTSILNQVDWSRLLECPVLVPQLGLRY